MTQTTLPVAIIGAGPVGLAAAAQLLARGLEPLVLEAGVAIGHAVRSWRHVRMFSPWAFNTDAAARALLEAEGWAAPDPDAYPTGGDLVDRYLAPLAATAALRGRIRTGARVIGVARRDIGRLHDGQGRDAAPLVLHVETCCGMQAIEARAVIDCSGSWYAPNPAGSHGMPAPGEIARADRIAYGIPDVLGAQRIIYAGRTTLVVGAGHSAMNAVLDLGYLAKSEPGTRILWAFRRPLGAVNFGGGARDGLAQRGALGARAQALVDSGAVTALAPFLIDRIGTMDGRLTVTGRQDGTSTTVQADRMIVATGFRPDLSFLREVRLGLDPAVEATPALAPLIDPNLHSCGSVRPHGEAQLRHPEAGFYIAGMKSYGRAPTFLLATGHEQVRSIAAFLAGDVAASRRVELVLPETGVCSTDRAPAASSSCCTPATPQGVCCAPKPELKAEATSCCAPKKPQSACMDTKQTSSAAALQPSFQIRPSSDDDIVAIAAIYGHHVQHGKGSFETEAPSVEDMRQRRVAIVERGLPYLVAVDVGGAVLGYAYAGAYRPRIAYVNTVENSVYVRHDCIGRGIGRTLLHALIERCEALGYRQMIAVVGDSANLASVRLHEAFGFRLIGALRSVGHKHGVWLDTVLLQRSLGEGDQTDPQPS
ncbi:MAG: FAD-dependent oxidoreductase [Rhodospirillales bacterium]|nr:FAD-dependent oxidoreductase [Rhodospirillales bacterium]